MTRLEFYCLVVVAIIVGWIIGGLILCFSVASYNFMVGGRGSPKSAPLPSIRYATSIVVVASLINFVVGYLTLGIIGASTITTDLSIDDIKSSITIQLILFLVTLLFLVIVFSMMLPTSFWRAFLISLIYQVICLVVFGIATLVIMAAMKMKPTAELALFGESGCGTTGRKCVAAASDDFGKKMEKIAQKVLHWKPNYGIHKYITENRRLSSKEFRMMKDLEVESLCTLHPESGSYFVSLIWRGFQ